MDHDNYNMTLLAGEGPIVQINDQKLNTSEIAPTKKKRKKDVKNTFKCSREDHKGF